jgi:superfamily II DNA/RNA helicase
MHLSPQDSSKDLGSAIDSFERGGFRFKNSPQSQVFRSGGWVGTDSDWVSLWTILGECLTPVFYALHSRQQDKVSVDELLEFAGSADRLLFKELDGAITQIRSPQQRGRLILRTIVAAIREADDSASDKICAGSQVASDGSELDEQAAELSTQIVSEVRVLFAEPLAAMLGLPADSVEAPPNSAQAVKRLWLRGLASKDLPTKSIPGLRHLTYSIGIELCPSSPYMRSQEEADPMLVVIDGPRSIPSDLAAKFYNPENSSRLLDHRDAVLNSHGYQHTGITDSGNSELDGLGFAHVFRRADDEPIVLYAPTSSGKTRFAQLAVIEAVCRRKENDGDAFGCAILLAPTKALVNQIARDFRQLLDGTSAESWVVVEGTRDHPQHNDALRTGRFDVAVAIPEKLTSMMRLGMSLAECPLLVIDEFQHIVDGARGLALEMLMVDIFERYASLRWIALSASLGEATRLAVDTWLEANGTSAKTLVARYRPVPLTVRGMSSSTVIEKVAGDTAAKVARDRTAFPVSLDSLDNNSKKFARNYTRVLDILFNHVLERDIVADGMPSIIVFLASKAGAEQMAAITARLAAQVEEFPVVDRRARPFESGRFSYRPGTPEASARVRALTEAFTLMSPSTLKTHLGNALTSGIGFHTATLNGDAREIIEEAFRLGYVRILFATDTLKLGVNLPSDVVINGEMHTSGRDVYYLIDRDSVIQRLGRAGRLGMASQGVGALVVPDRGTFPPYFVRNLTIKPEELESLGGGDHEVAIASVADPATVFMHYLDEWRGGAEYIPPASDTWLLDACLRIAGDASNNLTFDGMTLALEDLYRRSLRSSALGDIDSPASFSFASMIDQLANSGVLAPAEDGRFLATRLGWSLGSNGVSVTNAEAVQRIAAATADGAGPFTLLLLASASELCSRSTFQMSVQDPPSGGNSQNLLALISDAIGLTRDANEPKFQRFAPSVKDAIGQGPEADGVRALIESPAVRSAEEWTVLWRAAVLTLWWAGKPLKSLETAVGGNRPWVVGEVSIQQLAETAAYIIGAASDCQGVHPTDMSFRTLQHFAAEVETGLPTVFSPLLRTGHKTMNRSRLLPMIGLLEQENTRWDHIVDLLTVYTEKMSGHPTPRSRNAKESWAPLTSEHLAEIRASVDTERARRTRVYWTLPHQWRTATIPRGDQGQSLPDLLERLNRGVESLEVVEELLTEIGFDEGEDFTTDDTARRITIDVGTTDGSSHRTFIEVADVTTQVDHAFIDARRAELGADENYVIIDTGGCSDGVYFRADFLDDSCVVVHPNLFVEMIARVYFSQESGESEDTLEIDYQATKELMSRLLLNSAPVLNRTDLENRMAGLTLAR